MPKGAKKEPTVVIRELMAQPGIKKIRVFKSGDPYHQGVQVVVNDRQGLDMDILLMAITNRIDLPFGAKKLYTTSGSQVKSIRNVKDGTDYVASSGAFVPMAYGEQPGHRSRAKSVDPERKKKKKKRAASMRMMFSLAPHKLTQPFEHAEKEQPKEVVPKAAKKVKKVKKKKESNDEIVIPLNSEENEEKHLEEKPSDQETNHEEIRSVSRYADRPSSRPKSRLSFQKSRSVSSDKSQGTFSLAQCPYFIISDEAERLSEKEGSEIHIPSSSKEEEEPVHETNDHEKRNGEGKSPNEVLGDAGQKKRKSVYQWGDLSSFTKNIESLLKRKQ